MNLSLFLVFFKITGEGVLCLTSRVFWAAQKSDKELREDRRMSIQITYTYELQKSQWNAALVRATSLFVFFYVSRSPIMRTFHLVLQ